MRFSSPTGGQTHCAIVQPLLLINRTSFIPQPWPEILHIVVSPGPPAAEKGPPSGRGGRQGRQYAALVPSSPRVSLQHCPPSPCGRIRSRSASQPSEAVTAVPRLGRLPGNPHHGLRVTRAVPLPLLPPLAVLSSPWALALLLQWPVWPWPWPSAPHAPLLGLQSV